MEENFIIFTVQQASGAVIWSLKQGFKAFTRDKK